MVNDYVHTLSKWAERRKRRKRSGDRWIKSSEGERVIVGDLNGHVGISREAIERTHGGCGVGENNEEGERVSYFAMAFDLSIINTLFWKKPNHLETYKGGGRESQIHFLTCRRQQLK